MEDFMDLMRDEKTKKSVQRKVKLGIFLFLAFIIFMSTYYTVNTGEVAIIKTWGKITDVKEAGIHFKIPFVQTKTKLETREKTYTFVRQDGGYGTALEVSTRDIQSILVEFSVQAGISDPEKLYKAFGDKYIERFIVPRVQEIVQSAVAKYTIEEFVSKRAEISRLIFDDLKDDFEVYGLTVSNTSIVNHDFSNEYEKSVEAKKVAEQRVEEEKAKQQKMIVEAESRVRLAELQVKEKELIAKANKIEAESLQSNLLQKQFIEKWNGELPKVTGNSNAILPHEYLIK